MSAPKPSAQPPPGVFPCGCLWDGDLMRRDPSCSGGDHGGLRGVPIVVFTTEKDAPASAWPEPTDRWLWGPPDSPEGRA